MIRLFLPFLSGLDSVHPETIDEGVIQRSEATKNLGILRAEFTLS